MYRGVGHGIKVVVQNEGVKGLLRGLSCAYIYQMTLNGCRLGFYEPLRLSVNSLVLTKSPMNTTDPAVRNLQSLPVNIFSGAASGVLGAAAGSPFFLVKTRLQSYSPFLPVGTQHLYKNAADGMKQIYKAEGIKGLYRGVLPAMVRTGFGSSVSFPHTSLQRGVWYTTWAWRKARRCTCYLRPAQDLLCAWSCTHQTQS